MHPNPSIRYIIRMEVSNRKVINCNRLIQFNGLNFINRQVASISLLKFIAHLKFICEDPPFTLHPKRMVIGRLNDLLSNMQFKLFSSLARTLSPTSMSSIFFSPSSVSTLVPAVKQLHPFLAALFPALFAAFRAFFDALTTFTATLTTTIAIPSNMQPTSFWIVITLRYQMM